MHDHVSAKRNSFPSSITICMHFISLFFPCLETVCSTMFIKGGKTRQTFHSLNLRGRAFSLSLDVNCEFFIGALSQVKAVPFIPKLLINWFVHLFVCFVLCFVLSWWGDGLCQMLLCVYCDVSHSFCSLFS